MRERVGMVAEISALWWPLSWLSSVRFSIVRYNRNDLRRCDTFCHEDVLAANTTRYFGAHWEYILRDMCVEPLLCGPLGDKVAERSSAAAEEAVERSKRVAITWPLSSEPPTGKTGFS